VYGTTFGLCIILLEVTFLLFVKYNQTNFRFTAPVIALLISAIVVYIAAVMNFQYRGIEGEYPDKITKLFFSKLLSEFLVFFAFVYMIILVSGLLLIEYTSNSSRGDTASGKKTYSCQFYVLSVLSLLFCVLYGLWIMYK